MDPDAAADLRKNIHDRYAELHAAHKAAAADLANLTTAHDTQPAHDPTLLDLLPISDYEITTAADPTQRAIYDAFQLHITYHRPTTTTATIQATLTDDTPRRLHAITSSDPNPTSPATHTTSADSTRAPFHHLQGLPGVVPPGQHCPNGWRGAHHPPICGGSGGSSPRASTARRLAPGAVRAGRVPGAPARTACGGLRGGTRQMGNHH